MSQFRTGSHGAILQHLSVIDVDSVPAEDGLAFATGYITGKLGSPKDPVTQFVPLPDYDAGWDLGSAVFHGTSPKPEWDRSPTPAD